MTVRFDTATYQLLAQAASLTNRSMNALVNDAVSQYLGSPTFRQQVRERRSAAEAAIAKLAGETP